MTTIIPCRLPELCSHAKTSYPDLDICQFNILSANYQYNIDEKPPIEFKELPKNLRYEFLDEELNRLIIVNLNLGRDETTQL